MIKIGPTTPFSFKIDSNLLTFTKRIWKDSNLQQKKKKKKNKFKIDTADNTCIWNKYLVLSFENDI